MINDYKLLAEELQAERVTDRQRAAKMLALLGEEARYVAIPLLHALEDEDEEVLNWTTEALENMGPPLETSLQSLVNLAQTSAHADTQYFSLILIGRLGKQAGAVYPELQEMLTRPHTPQVQRQLYKTLARTVPANQVSNFRSELERRKQDEADPALQSLAERLLEELQ